MAKKDELRKIRAGTIINVTSKKQESEAIQALTIHLKKKRKKKMVMFMSNWDAYFMEIARAVSQNSKCFSRKIGVVIVKDRFVISTGYNGVPRGVIHCEHLNPNNELECPRKLKGYVSSKDGEPTGLHLCRAAHAERNAIDIAARLGHHTDGCTMYCMCPIPCIECAKSIINAGIKEVVITEFKEYQKDINSLGLLENAGVCVRLPNGKDK